MSCPFLLKAATHLLRHLIGRTGVSRIARSEITHAVITTANPLLSPMRPLQIEASLASKPSQTSAGVNVKADTPV